MNYNNKKKFNIIHVIPRPDGGGAELLVRHLSNFLKKNNFNIFTIYFHNPSKIKLKTFEHNLNLAGPRDIRAIWYLRKKLFEISDKNPMIVHAHLSSPLYILPLATLGLKTINIFTEHNTFNKRRKFKVFNFIEKIIYSKYQKIICISKGTKKSLIDWLGLKMTNKKIMVIYNGSRIFNYAKRNRVDLKKIKLISIGSLTDQKGFDIAINAISQIKEYIQKYIIIGDGVKKKKLIALAKKLNISDKVFFTGFKKNFQNYLSDADIGLIPSRWEGFGLVAIEMLSSGLPIICSNTEGLKEIVKNCPAVMLVKPGYPEQLAKKITQKAKILFENHNKISIIGRKHSEQYNFTNYYINHAKLYSSIIPK